MNKAKRKTIYGITGGLSALTLVSGFILSIPKTFADTTDTVRVSIPVSCYLESEVGTAHEATLRLGSFTENIGETTLKAFCNDASGFGLYAVGFTDDEYGKTVMSSDTSDTYDIITGTATSGDTSNWSMKLTAVSGDYPATIDNNFDSYSAVPSIYTKVASRSSHTDFVSGAELKTTYGIYVNDHQLAGTYEGKVKYTLLHPGATKPNTIQPMQGFQCSSLANVGDSTLLRDIRDNEVYSVAKLADGKCWMTQNLRLDLATANITAENTNNPTSDFLAELDAIEAQNDSWATVRTASYYSNADSDYYYYNWYAATAGNGLPNLGTEAISIDGSICPSGWHLPTGQTENDITNGEFGSLAVALGGPTTSNVAINATTETSPSGSELSTILQNAPNNMKIPTIFSSTSPYSRYWSRTYGTINHAYSLTISHNAVRPGTAYTDNAQKGFVRCLAN